MTKNTGQKKEIIWTSDENRIALDEYSALTLDTCVVEETGFNFNNSVLATLENQSIPVVLSEIVDKEIRDHIHKQRKKAVDQLKNANNDLHRKNFITTDVFKQMQDNADEIGAKDPYDLFNKFKTHNSIIEIEANTCEIDELLAIYFNSQSPFGVSDKKNEFPDAIALLSLEVWAKENDKKILAFSKDKDWMSFSERSKYIDVVTDLATGLQEIQIPVNKKVEKIREIISSINLGKYQKLRRIIDEFLMGIDTKAYILKNNSPSLGIETLLNVNFLEVKYDPGSFNIPDHKELLNLLVLPSLDFTENFIITIYINVSSIVEIKSHYVSDDIGYSHRVRHRELNFMSVPIRAMFTLDGNVLVDNVYPKITNISLDGSIEILFNYLDFTSVFDYGDF